MKPIRALAALLLLAAFAPAQDPTDLLLRVVSLDGRDGVRLLGAPAAGALYVEGMREETVRVGAGEHVVIGACEGACDVDVRVFDGTGRLVASDLEARAHAIVDLPAGAATYRVRLTMAACETEPCRFALGTFRAEP